MQHRLSLVGHQEKSSTTEGTEKTIKKFQFSMYSVLSVVQGFHSSFFAVACWIFSTFGSFQLPVTAYS